MHPIFFGFKRAHHATLTFTRPLAHHFGLTPARFDMLGALFRDPYHGLNARRYVPQADLARILGVCRAVVSRMLRALEELGLVERRPIRTGGRRLLVYLSEEGLGRMSAALDSVLGSGIIRLAVDSIMAPHEWISFEATGRAKKALRSYLDLARAGLGDRASFEPPVHVDEHVPRRLPSDDGSWHPEHPEHHRYAEAQPEGDYFVFADQDEYDAFLYFLEYGDDP